MILTFVVCPDLYLYLTRFHSFFHWFCQFLYIFTSFYRLSWSFSVVHSGMVPSWAELENGFLKSSSVLRTGDRVVPSNVPSFRVCCWSRRESWPSRRCASWTASRDIWRRPRCARCWPSAASPSRNNCANSRPASTLWSATFFPIPDPWHGASFTEFFVFFRSSSTGGDAGSDRGVDQERQSGADPVPLPGARRGRRPAPTRQTILQIRLLITKWKLW